jgi:hypothetical protein
MLTMPQFNLKDSPSEPLAAKVLARVPRGSVALLRVTVVLRLVTAPHHNVRWHTAMATVMAGMYIFLSRLSANSNTSSSKKPKGETTANIPRSNSGKAPYSEYSGLTLR